MAEIAASAAIDPLEPRQLVPPHHDDRTLNDTLLDFVWKRALTRRGPSAATDPADVP